MAVRSQVAGCGSYLPLKVMSNEDLAAQIETSDAWISMTEPVAAPATSPAPTLASTQNRTRSRDSSGTTKRPIAVAKRPHQSTRPGKGRRYRAAHATSSTGDERNSAVEPQLT